MDDLGRWSLAISGGRRRRARGAGLASPAFQGARANRPPEALLTFPSIQQEE